MNLRQMARKHRPPLPAFAAFPFVAHDPCPATPVSYPAPTLAKNPAAFLPLGYDRRTGNTAVALNSQWRQRTNHDAFVESSSEKSPETSWRQAGQKGLRPLSSSSSSLR